MILVMSRSIAQGSSAGIATAAGVSVGLMGHTILATLGLGAVLRTSELSFLILKMVGATYLLYLGIQLLRTKDVQLGFQNSQHKSLRRLFTEGALSNLSNPKVALFYFAFLPQFLLDGNDNTTLSLFTLGSLFATLTFLIKGPIGYFSGSLSTWIHTHPIVLTWIHRISGVILVGLGIKLFLDERG